MGKSKIINILGGPHSGKTTIAHDVFSKLSYNGESVEFSPEFAKELVLSNRIEDLSDSLYLFAEQNHRLKILDGKFDIIVADRSLITTPVYNRMYFKPEYKKLDDLALDIFNSYDNINFYIERDMSIEYKKNNTRVEELNEALKLDVEIKEYLDSHNIVYYSIKESDHSGDEIIKRLYMERYALRETI